MPCESCPSTEDLLCFLNEQLDVAKAADVGTHVNVCLQCQGALEELIQSRACGLCLPTRGPSGEPFVEGPNSSPQTPGNNTGTEPPCDPAELILDQPPTEPA